MKVIDKVSNKFKLSESGQGSLEMKFAFFNPETEEVITPFCKCKDYFNDAFWAKRNSKNTELVHGFQWNKDDDKGLFDKDTISIAVKFHEKTKPENTLEDTKRENLDNIISLLHRFDDGNSFKLSEGDISEDQKFFVITVDRKWTDLPYLLSGLFLFMRLGYHYDRKSNIREYYVGTDAKRFIAPYDASYVRTSIDIIEDIEKGFLDDSQKYSDYQSGYDAHGSSGIVGYKNKYKSPKVEMAPAEVTTTK